MVLEDVLLMLYFGSCCLLSSAVVIDVFLGNFASALFFNERPSLKKQPPSRLLLHLAARPFLRHRRRIDLVSLGGLYQQQLNGLSQRVSTSNNSKTNIELLIPFS
ncbi:unnamed protein product [Polarella glacialis]|uniref:Uncharacterized protein n=1 Tax=Polarella glacialis TaxID=89957 RepID=A0A813G918_POLGL|nr:unnamed protein product [Polarella glacialis]